MSVPSAVSSISYAGNNSTAVAYVVPFKFFAASHLEVTVVDAAGNETNVPDGLFTVTGAGADVGGTLKTYEAVPASSTVFIRRNTPMLNSFVWSDVSSWSGKTLEKNFDWVFMVAIDAYRRGGEAEVRSLRLPFGETLAALPLPADRALKYLRFDEFGNLDLREGIEVGSDIIDAVGAQIGSAILAAAEAATARDDAQYAASTIGDGGAVTNPEAFRNALRMYDVYSDAIVDWRFDEGSGGNFHDSRNPAKSLNMLAAGAGAFSEQGLAGAQWLWKRQAFYPTPTDNFATGPDGKAGSATRMAFFGANSYITQLITVTNALHRFGIWVKNPGASAVTIRGHYDGNFVALATLAANQDWTFVSFTFTPAAGAREIGFGNDGVTASTILVWGATLTLASVPVPGLSFRDGTAGKLGTLTWTSEGVKITGKASAASVPQETLQAVTIMVAFKAVSAPGTFHTYGLLSTGYNKMYLALCEGGLSYRPTFLFGAARATPHFSDFLDGKWHIAFASYDPTTGKARLAVDGVVLAETTLAGQSVSINALQVAGWVEGGSGFPDTLGAMAMWRRALSTREQGEAMAQARATLEARGADFSDSDEVPLVFMLGDSITAAMNNELRIELGTDYPLSFNFAVGGKTIDEMITDQIPQVLAKLQPGRKSMVRILIGRNNPGHSNPAWAYTPTQFMERLKQAVALLYGGGVTAVLIATELPSTDTAWNTWRNLVNPLIVAGDGIWFHKVVPYHLNVQMGQDDDAANTGAYSDGTHPTGAGNASLAVDDHAALNAVLAVI